MKIIVAPDSFKGTIRSTEVCSIWREVLLSEIPRAEVICLPMADGGEGSMEAVAWATGGKMIPVNVEDGIGRNVCASYTLFPDCKCAFVETAAACGLELLADSERNPLLTSSYGAGQLIAAALDGGVRELVIGLGGSGTVDGGAGMLQALGYRLLDSKGKDIQRGGAGLENIAAIDDSGAHPALKEAKIRIACDVTNPLLGTAGAATVFGPQKGATAEMVVRLEKALAQFSAVTMKLGIADRCDAPGDGAAGGMGFSMRTFLGAEITSGARLIAETVGLERHLDGASLLITGEGRSDRQTLYGKLPSVLAEVAASHGVPAILCSGAVEDGEMLGRCFQGIFSTVQAVRPLEDVLASAKENLRITARGIAAALKIGASNMI